jgi:hypothetical protein
MQNQPEVFIDLPLWLDILIIVGFMIWLNQQRRWSEWRRRNDTNPPQQPELGPIRDLFSVRGEGQNPVPVMIATLIVVVLAIVFLRVGGLL